MKTSELKPGDIVTINYGPLNGSEDATVTAVREVGDRHVAEIEKCDGGEFDSLWSDSTETPTAIGWRLRSFSPTNRQTLTVSFEVDDDLTSERAADYRETILNALRFHAGVGNPDEDELQRIDALLNDVNRN